MQKQIKKIRAFILESTIEKAIPVYRKLRPNKKPWTTSLEAMAKMPSGSLGKTMAKFMKERNITFIPEFEHHDFCHFFTGYGMDCESESRLQFYLLGNGKSSLFVWGTCVLSWILMPDFWTTFIKDFQRGQQEQAFHQWDFESLLFTPVSWLQDFIRIKNINLINL